MDLNWAEKYSGPGSDLFPTSGQSPTLVLKDIAWQVSSQAILFIEVCLHICEFTRIFSISAGGLGDVRAA